MKIEFSKAEKIETYTFQEARRKEGLHKQYTEGGGHGLVLYFAENHFVVFTNKEIRILSYTTPELWNSNFFEAFDDVISISNE